MILFLPAVFPASATPEALGLPVAAHISAPVASPAPVVFEPVGSTPAGTFPLAALLPPKLLPVSAGAAAVVLEILLAQSPAATPAGETANHGKEARQAF